MLVIVLFCNINEKKKELLGIVSFFLFCSQAFIEKDRVCMLICMGALRILKVQPELLITWIILFQLIIFLTGFMELAFFLPSHTKDQQIINTYYRWLSISTTGSNSVPTCHFLEFSCQFVLSDLMYDLILWHNIDHFVVL